MEWYHTFYKRINETENPDRYKYNHSECLERIVGRTQYCWNPADESGHSLSIADYTGYQWADFAAFNVLIELTITDIAEDMS